MAFKVHIRDEKPPDSMVIMLRAGEHGLRPNKILADAALSLAAQGIQGVSVTSAHGDETFEQAWAATRVTAERRIVWWTTAGRLRAAGFPLLTTGRDPRHFTVVLATLDEELMARLLAQFRRAVKP